MSHPVNVRRLFVALLGAVALSGCVADTSGGGIVPPPPPPPPVDTGPPPSDIGLSPGFFSGRDGAGTKIRAQVKANGRDYRVQSLKGKNGPERLYRDQGGNKYRASNGYTIRVTSSRSFYWNGPHGGLTMND